MAEVIIDRATKRFGDVEAVSDVSLAVPSGELVVLLGPTGAGKTTLLRLVAGLEKPDAGAIAIAGRDATTQPPALRDVAFVFQHYSLYPHLCVYDNLAFPLRAPARRVGEAEIRARVERVARLVRIDHKLANPATRLSGGEMQRVAIGRAVIHRPQLILADEPTGNLDSKTGEVVLQLIRSLHDEQKPTVVMATHSEHAASFGDYIIRIADGRVSR